MWVRSCCVCFNPKQNCQRDSRFSRPAVVVTNPWSIPPTHTLEIPSIKISLSTEAPRSRQIYCHSLSHFLDLQSPTYMKQPLCHSFSLMVIEPDWTYKPWTNHYIMSSHVDKQRRPDMLRLRCCLSVAAEPPGAWCASSLCTAPWWMDGWLRPSQYSRKHGKKYQHCGVIWSKMSKTLFLYGIWMI